MRVGYIGLGSQGGPIARRIIEAGHPTMLWARRPESLEPFAATAAALATDLAELGATCDLVCLCVFDDGDVEEVATALLPTMAPGSLLAVQSTVRPGTCVRLAALAAERGVTLFDAPVSGGPGAAERGQLVVMVGGSRDVFDRVRPVFDCFGDPVVHVGPVGAGQAVKVVNNLLFMAQMTMADDAIALAEQFAIDRDALVQVVGKGSGASFAFGIRSGIASMEEFGALGGAARLRKDLDIVHELTTETGSSTGVLLDVAEDGMRRAGSGA